MSTSPVPARQRPPTGATLRTLLAAITRDFCAWPGSRARVIDDVASLAAVMLAVAASRLLAIDNVGWAAFSAYMVIRTSFAESLARGSLRIAGTVAGVALACLLAPHLMGSTALLSAALALSGALTLYRALMDRHGYGWLIAGLSFAMVLVDAMQHADRAVSDFALARIAEVAVGSIAAVLVSAAASLALAGRWRPVAPAAPVTPAAPVSPVAPAPLPPGSRQVALRHALQGAIALGLIPWVWSSLHWKALSQSSITIMVVLIVPLADLAAPAVATSARLRQRLLGCCIGGVLATAVLLTSHASPLAMTLAAGIGVVVGRHLENGAHRMNYAGTQLALAFLVVLIPDGAAGPGIMPGIERLSGIVLGMALLEPVRRWFNWLDRRT